LSHSKVLTHHLMTSQIRYQVGLQLLGLPLTSSFPLEYSLILVNRSCQWRRRGDWSAYLGPEGSDPWISTPLSMYIFRSLSRLAKVANEIAMRQQRYSNWMQKTATEKWKFATENSFFLV